MYRRKPQTILLDMTTWCNLKCPMCPQSFEEFDKTRYKGIMDFEMSKQIIDQLYTITEEKNVGCVLPYWNGEPLLYPKFIEFLEYCKSKDIINHGIGAFDLNTNAGILTNKKSKAILESQLFPSILFSIDATTKSTYDKVRAGGDFYQTIDNIKNFVKMREEYRIENPQNIWPYKIIFQFIIMEINQHEALQFYHDWSTFLKSYNLDFQVNYWWDEPALIMKDTIFLKRCFEGGIEHQNKLNKLHKKVVHEIGLISDDQLKSKKMIFRTDEITGQEIF